MAKTEQTSVKNNGPVGYEASPFFSASLQAYYADCSVMMKFAVQVHDTWIII